MHCIHQIKKGKEFLATATSTVKNHLQGGTGMVIIIQVGYNFYVRVQVTKLHIIKKQTLKGWHERQCFHGAVA